MTGLRVSRRTKMISLSALAALAIAYAVISLLIARGITAAERKPQEGHPADYGLAVDEVTFSPRGDDFALEGWYIEARGGKPTIIFVHGQGSIRSGDSALAMADRLSEQGYGSLLFDLRGHGSSQGTRASGGFYEQRDVLGAFDFLRKRGISSQRIGFVGFSMGAATTALAAADEPAIRAMVLDSPYARANDFIGRETERKTVLPRWIVPVFLPASRLIADKAYGIDLGSMVPEEAVDEIDYPVLVIHGKADGRIPFEHGVRVHDSAPAGSELWLVPDVDHVDSFTTHPDEYIRRIIRYFEGRLDLGPTSG